MKAFWIGARILALLVLAPIVEAQHVAISGGGVFMPYLSSPPRSGTVGGLERADFGDSPMLAIDAGVFLF
jgi:hypothetical protein